MLPREQRLSRQRFARLSNPKRFTSDHVSLSYRDGVEHGGATVVISKKTIPTATGRNRMKRRIRPLLTPFLRPNRALAVFLRKDADTIPFSVLRKELQSLLASLP